MRYFISATIINIILYILFILTILVVRILDLHSSSQTVHLFLTFYILLTKVFSISAISILFRKGIKVAKKLEIQDFTEDLISNENNQNSQKNALISKKCSGDFERKTTLGELAKTKEIYVKVRM